MSLATRQPHSSGSNLCKQVINKTLDLPHSLYYSTHLYSTTSASCSSRVVLYTNTRLRQPAHSHPPERTPQCKLKPYRNTTSSALHFNLFSFFLSYFYYYFLFLHSASHRSYNSVGTGIVNNNIYYCCDLFLSHLMSCLSQNYLFIYERISAVRIYVIPQSLKGPQII